MLVHPQKPTLGIEITAGRLAVKLSPHPVKMPLVRSQLRVGAERRPAAHETVLAEPVTPCLVNVQSMKGGEPVISTFAACEWAFAGFAGPVVRVEFGTGHVQEVVHGGRGGWT